ncbi:MAG: hypothetical protein ABFR62_14245, partial [Bacteroidota bacterium]
NLPVELMEASGIAAQTDSTFWMMNDSGNPPELFLVDYKGNIIGKKYISNAANSDWEELTSDVNGNLYIGDFGDNNQNRTDCKILKVEKSALNSKKDTISVSKQSFRYSTDRSYDAEAMIHMHNSIYIFTKNREPRFDGTTILFKLSPNDSIAQFQSKIKLYSDIRELSWVTSASLSPDKSALILLSSDKMFVFSNFEKDKFFEGDMQIISLETLTQKEAVDFISNSEIIITDEDNSGIGGKLYYVDLKEVN